MLLAGCKFQSSHCCSSGAGLGWTEGRGREGRKAGAGAPRLSSSRILSPRRRATCPRDSRAGRANSRGRVLTNLHEAPGVRASQKAGEPAAGEETTRRPGGCAPRTCASRRCPGAARGRPGRERARAWTRPRAGAAPAERARGRLRAEGVAQPRRGPRPPTHPPPAPGASGPVTFLLSPHLFLLVAGVHAAVGVAGFKLQVPQAHGQTGCVECVGGREMEGTLGWEKCKGSASRAASRSPVAALLPSARPLCPAAAATAAPQSLSTRSRLALT